MGKSMNQRSGNKCPPQDQRMFEAYFLMVKYIQMDIYEMQIYTGKKSYSIARRINI